MNVRLLSWTPNADSVLILTKNTRLQPSTELLDDIVHRRGKWTDEYVAEQLRYIANTIPSSWGFVNYIFLVSGVSRAYTHQQVRTAFIVFAQQSLRVVDGGEYDYVFTDRNLESPEAMRLINECNDKIKATYRALIAIGQPVEDARGVLPTNIATALTMNVNLRTLAETVQSRSGGRTQSEYQKIITACAAEVIRVHPWAELFLYPKSRDYFNEIEEFAKREYPNDLQKKGELLKIVDKMRKMEVKR